MDYTQAKKKEMASKMGSTMGKHVGSSHPHYDSLAHDGGKEPHVVMGTTINSKKGMKYEQTGKAKGSLAQKPRMVGTRPRETGGEKYPEADTKDKFSANYTQHAKAKEN